MIESNNQLNNLAPAFIDNFTHVKSEAINAVSSYWYGPSSSYISVMTHINRLRRR